MNERRMIEVTGLLAAILLVLALPLWAAEMTNISGTILALTKEAGTIVVGEGGARPPKDGHPPNPPPPPARISSFASSTRDLRPCRCSPAIFSRESL